MEQTKSGTSTEIEYSPTGFKLQAGVSTLGALNDFDLLAALKLSSSCVK